jgi:CheY-like chemotaxis protein
MNRSLLQGYRILVVEDEYLLARELHSSLESAGATVVGPVGSVDDALSMLDLASELDAAVLDVNLRGQKVFEFADALKERGVPFIFTTGYESSIFPERYADVPRCEKPFETEVVAYAIQETLSRKKTH